MFALDDPHAQHSGMGTMIRGLRLGPAFILLVLLAHGAWMPVRIARLAAQPDATPAAVVGDIDALLEPIRERHDLPALAGAIVYRDRVIGLGAVGVRARGSPAMVSTEDRWHIGSCTKAMTATLIAVLVEEGTMSWELTIGQAFPDLAGQVDPQWLEVTVHQLLTHRSGLPDDRTPDATVFPKVRALRGPIATQRRELARLVLERPPAIQPGSAMAYSNYGYVVAGAMAEAVTGDSWEDLLRARVLAPLGMDSTGFGPPGSADSLTQPRGHNWRGPIVPGPWADNPPVLGPAGTVHATMRDWGRFVAVHLDRGRGPDGGLLEPATVARLHSPASGQQYALGWVVVDRPWGGGSVLTHAGSNTLWYAVVWAAPEREFAVLVATNIGGAGAAKAADEAAWALIQHFQTRNQ